MASEEIGMEMLLRPWSDRLPRSFWDQRARIPAQGIPAESEPGVGLGAECVANASSVIWTVAHLSVAGADRVLPGDPSVDRAPGRQRRWGARSSHDCSRDAASPVPPGRVICARDVAAPTTSTAAPAGSVGEMNGRRPGRNRSGRCAELGRSVFHPTHQGDSSSQSLRRAILDAEGRSGIEQARRASDLPLRTQALGSSVSATPALSLPRRQDCRPVRRRSAGIQSDPAGE